jgi:hypothetical protein
MPNRRAPNLQRRRVGSDGLYNIEHRQRRGFREEANPQACLILLNRQARSGGTKKVNKRSLLNPCRSIQRLALRLRILDRFALMVGAAIPSIVAPTPPKAISQTWLKNIKSATRSPLCSAPDRQGRPSFCQNLFSQERAGRAFPRRQAKHRAC